MALRQHWDDADPVIYLEMADMSVNQLELVLLVINDPESERYDVDRMPDGRSTSFGTECRNLAEEERAMEAGLAPAQIRHGARLARRLIPQFESSVARLGHDRVHIQPLAYHNAILFERYGFAYSIGRGKMEWIDAEFASGGLLDRRLDGSTPFRQPGAGSTVRGRSWAVHDGILGEPYGGIRMYKRVGIHAGLCTFCDAAW
jgi:acetoin utilization protein AcuC